MKKYIMAAIALLMCGSAMAIDNEPKQGATFVGFMGMTVSNIRNSDLDNKVGGTAGVKMDYVLPKAHGTYISTGVDWVMKGAKSAVYFGEPGLVDIDGTYKVNAHYMEIPVHAGFRYNLNKEIGFYGELGPYFAVGVGGKNKIKVDADGPQFRDMELDWKTFKKSTEDFNFQRWDCGMGFRVGAEYNQHYNLMLGCDWGFTDMFRDSYRDAHYQDHLSRIKNFDFVIAFGYRF